MNISSIQQLIEAGLTTEQMAVVMKVLAVELAPIEQARAKAAERQRVWKEKRQHNVSGNVTETVSVPTPLRDIYNNNPSQVLENKPTPTPSVPKNSRAHGTNPRALGTNPRARVDEHPQFGEFWDAYPKRDGTADRKGAAQAFNSAAKRADVAIIIAGARGYATFLGAKGKIGTEFVKQARAWLNKDLWTEYQPQPAPEPFKGTSNGQVFVKQGTDAFDAWSRVWKRTKGISPPTNSDGGWYFPSEYPQEQAA